MSFWRRWLRCADMNHPTAMAAPPKTLSADRATETALAHIGVDATGVLIEEKGVEAPALWRLLLGARARVSKSERVNESARRGSRRR